MCDAAFWNWAMVATARFVPVKILTDRAKIRAFAKKTNPVIKLVDPLIGEKVTHPKKEKKRNGKERKEKTKQEKKRKEKTTSFGVN